jgi:Uma2 family endonuclease
MEYSKTMTAWREPSPPDMRFVRFTGQMFDRMLESGVFAPDTRIELLDGQLFEGEEMKPPHIERVTDLNERLVLQFYNRARVLCQSAIELPTDGRPLPDLVLVSRDAPRDVFVQPSDIYLLIEIADSSLERDRDHKQKIYARDGVREYWILNLENNSLEVYRDPENQQYSNKHTLKAGKAASCLAFPQDKIEWF